MSSSRPASSLAPRLARVVYLSNDGMTDALGRSQVLPYLSRLAAKGHRIRLVSLEKSDAFARDGATVRALCTAAGIEWHPLPYWRRPPILGGWFNSRRLEAAAARLLRGEPADIFHARSDLPARAGLSLRRRFGGRLLWDMRSLWADERAEGGQWDQRRWVYRRLLAHFRALQARLVHEADGIVTLSNAGKAWLDGHGATGRIEVIPCCADFDLFRPDANAREAIRAALGLAGDDRLFLHLGSIGCNVMLNEMMAFMARAIARDPATRLLFLAPGEHGLIRAAARRAGIEDRLHVASAAREGVAAYVAASDVGLFFVKPTPAKIAASPTKLGEMLAAGLPVVTGPSVGDVEAIVAACAAGVVVGSFEDAAYDAALDRLVSFRIDPATLRERAREIFDVARGAASYDRLYRALLA